MIDDSGRLAISVSHVDGRTTRWGAEEVDAGRIPNDLTFGDSTPGGFSTMSCGLLRDLEPRSDEGLFDGVSVYGPGGQVAFEGRIAQLPRQTGSETSLSPGAVGHSAHLLDDESFMEVYVALGAAGWGAASLARRAVFATANRVFDKDYTFSSEGGLTFTGTSGTAIPANSATEAWFAMPPGVEAAVLQYVATQANTASIAGPTAFWSDNEDGSSPGSVAPTLDGTLRTATLGNKRYLFLYAAASAGHTPANPYSGIFTKLAVFGNHGLTRHAPGAGEPDGLYASDVIADVLPRAAPGLGFTTGANGTIQPTTFVIPHLAFTEPTTAADAIARVNAYHDWDWLVWENRTFHYQPAGSGVEWQARLGDGAALSLEGDSAEQIINGVIVAYQDNGIQKYAGPVGSGMDVESAYLEDSSVDNPATAHGLTRWVTKQITVPTTDAGAVQLGYIFLTEANLAARRGQITLTGSVRHPTEGMVPVWRPRSGDTIKITDRVGDPPRRIVEKTYSHSGRQCVLTLDSTARKADALLERIAAYTGALTA